MKKYAFLSILVIVVVVACAPTASREGTEIAEQSKAWAAGFNSENPDAIAALYSGDARLMAPNAQMEQGSEAVRATFGAMIEAGLGIELDTVETRVAGDIGYRVGTYSLTAGGEEVDRGKYVEVWRKLDGVWKITADIWNSDLAAETSQGATLMGTHEVEDAAKWLAAWQGEDSRRALFAEHGAPHVSVFQSPDNPNLTGLLIQVSDMEALQALLDSEEGRAAAAEDGVKFDTLRLLAAVD
ncbi:MAG: DUF4440 domain-containing protein [Acidobacteriota bacterium]|nr:DUF4440 domain-containing protein [Acidobacteriota bacterium]